MEEKKFVQKNEQKFPEVFKLEIWSLAMHDIIILFVFTFLTIIQYNICFISVLERFLQPHFDTCR
jgi:hypothetical protein